ncbi:MAG: L7Ae/L30e/S12e/Gadd45 family protein [Clostridia bacterium]|nr:L7Ae/L30e/S12e/Gadd45 family protein [Clostridia bacterium]
MGKQDFLTLLGFAQKSGKVVSGDAQVKAVMKKGQVQLLILAEDLSEKRKKYWSYFAKEEGIPSLILGKKQELGLAIGLSPRSVVGITDAMMVKALLKKL